jgi:hypothetical protein
MKGLSRTTVIAISLLILGLSPLATAQQIGIYGADGSYNADVVAKVEGTGLFDSVSFFDARNSTPTLGELLEFDAVLVYSDGSFQDNAAMGDVLADYVDQGRTVAIATFAFWDPEDQVGISGRLATDGYLPFSQGSQSQPGGLTLVAIDPNHPLLAGVSSFNGGTSSFHNANIAFEPDAEQVASWSNGEPLIGALSQPNGGMVVGLNFYPPSSDIRNDFWDADTDGDLIMANALLYMGEQQPIVQPLAVPVNSRLALLILALSVLLVATFSIRPR